MLRHNQALDCRCRAYHCIRTAFAHAQRLEDGQVLGGHAQRVAFLRFVAPQLHRRQRCIVARYLRQIDHAADLRVVQQFGDRIRQTTGADVVRRTDRVGFAQRDTAVKHFLATPLHLGVVALHRGEIQRFGTLARSHRRRRATTESDQHRRAAQHDHRIAGPQREFCHLRTVDRTDAAGQHDRFVVAARLARLAAIDLERTEIPAQRRPAEFVVERRRADRPVEHDVQRAGHARIQRPRAFPWLRQGRDAQMRNRESGQTGLGFAAAAGRAFVADLAARTGRSASERRDRGRMVMGFDLDAERRRQRGFAAIAPVGIGAEAARGAALDHRRIVAVGAERELRRLRVGMPDHPEQRGRLRLSVDAVIGVEDLVPAMFGIGLREHHQFGVGRRAPEFAKAVAQILDFLRRQGQAETSVGILQRGQRNPLQHSRRGCDEQAGGILAARQQRLRHRIVQQSGQCRPCGIVRCMDRIGQTVDPQLQATLDPPHRKAGATQDLAGLAGPRRERSQPRHHVPRRRCGRSRSGLLAEYRRAFEDARQRHRIGLRARLGFDEIHVSRGANAQIVVQHAQAGLKTVATKRRQGRLALEHDHAELLTSGARQRDAYSSPAARRSPGMQSDQRAVRDFEAFRNASAPPACPAPGASAPD